MLETEDLGKKIPTQEFYTLREVAMMLRVSERTMRELLQGGEVHGHKLGGQWRIPHAEIQRLRAAGVGESSMPVSPAEQSSEELPDVPYDEYD